ncbi:MAG TPA: hypothetical protein VFV33_15280, partial [Gemmatimonadaceae bacterium]|nr:hypothetical protein [Gemmatimonadaceae bacterium]
MLRSLSTRILIGFLLVATVPVVAVAAWDDWATRRETLDSASREVRDVAGEVAEGIEQYLAPRSAAVTLASRLLNPRSPLTAEDNQEALRALRAAFPEFRTAALFDTLGVLRTVEPWESGTAGTSSLIGQSFAHREYFRRAMGDTATVTTSVYRGRGVGNQVIIAFGRALRDREGRTHAVLQASLNLSGSDVLFRRIHDAGLTYVVT